jgi:hypothetical protein
MNTFKIIVIIILFYVHCGTVTQNVLFVGLIQIDEIQFIVIERWYNDALWAAISGSRDGCPQGVEWLGLDRA